MTPVAMWKHKFMCRRLNRMKEDAWPHGREYRFDEAQYNKYFAECGKIFCRYQPQCYKRYEALNLFVPPPKPPPKCSDLLTPYLHVMAHHADYPPDPLSKSIIRLYEKVFRRNSPATAESLTSEATTTTAEPPSPEAIVAAGDEDHEAIVAAGNEDHDPDNDSSTRSWKSYVSSGLEAIHSLVHIRKKRRARATGEEDSQRRTKRARTRESPDEAGVDDESDPNDVGVDDHSGSDEVGVDDQSDGVDVGANGGDDCQNGDVLASDDVVRDELAAIAANADDVDGDEVEVAPNEAVVNAPPEVAPNAAVVNAPPEVAPNAVVVNPPLAQVNGSEAVENRAAAPVVVNRPPGPGDVNAIEAAPNVPTDGMGRYQDPVLNDFLEHRISALDYCYIRFPVGSTARTEMARLGLQFVNLVIVVEILGDLMRSTPKTGLPPDRTPALNRQVIRTLKKHLVARGIYICCCLLGFSSTGQETKGPGYDHDNDTRKGKSNRGITLIKLCHNMGTEVTGHISDHLPDDHPWKRLMLQLIQFFIGTFQEEVVRRRGPPTPLLTVEGLLQTNAYWSLYPKICKFKEDGTWSNYGCAYAPHITDHAQVLKKGMMLQHFVAVMLFYPHYFDHVKNMFEAGHSTTLFPLQEFCPVKAKTLCREILIRAGEDATKFAQEDTDVTSHTGDVDIRTDHGHGEWTYDFRRVYRYPYIMDASVVVPRNEPYIKRQMRASAILRIAQLGPPRQNGAESSSDTESEEE